MRGEFVEIRDERSVGSEEFLTLIRVVVSVEEEFPEALTGTEDPHVQLREEGRVGSRADVEVKGRECGRVRSKDRANERQELVPVRHQLTHGQSLESLLSQEHVLPECWDRDPLGRLPVEGLEAGGDGIGFLDEVLPSGEKVGCNEGLEREAVGLEALKERRMLPTKLPLPILLTNVEVDTHCKDL